MSTRARRTRATSRMGSGFSRAVSTSFWRVFSPPPQDWPLAVVDFQSLDDDEGMPNTLYFVDEIPDDPFGPIVGSPRTVSGWSFITVRRIAGTTIRA